MDGGGVRRFSCRMKRHFLLNFKAAAAVLTTPVELFLYLSGFNDAILLVIVYWQQGVYVDFMNLKIYHLSPLNVLIEIWFAYICLKGWMRVYCGVYGVILKNMGIVISPHSTCPRLPHSISPRASLLGKLLPSSFQDRLDSKTNSTWSMMVTSNPMDCAHIEATETGP